ncbi:MAG: hypothetical protein U1F43_07295 [Myxococcota bacterium]
MARAWRSAALAGAVLGAGAIGVSACGDGGGDEGDVSDDASEVAAPETWGDGIDDIFRARCTPCHSWAETYAGVVAKIESGRLEEQVSAGHNVPSGDQAVLLDWVAAGYPQ